MNKSILALAVLLVASSPAFAQTPTPQESCKVVSFFAVYPDGVVRPYMNGPYAGWLRNWVKKSAKKYPQTCFSQTPLDEGHENYSIILSESLSTLRGLHPTVVTSTIPISGTATDQYGRMWSFDGTLTTTQTVEIPYEIDTRVLYAVAYDEQGNMVDYSSHVYSTAIGGGPGYALGYNVVNAVRAIHARGRLLDAAMVGIDDTEKRKKDAREAEIIKQHYHGAR